MSLWKTLLVFFLLVAAVGLVPFGGPFATDSNPLSLILRGIAPTTEQQRAELAFYDCLKTAGDPVPNSETVEVVVSQGFGRDGIGYLEQRLDEILFPRVRVVEFEARYEYKVFPIDVISQAEFEALQRGTDVLGLYQCAYALIVVERKI